MNRPTLTIRVKDLRKGKELTQEELAKYLGISRQSIIALENGRYLPSIALACQIAEFFDCSLDQLFSSEEAILSTNYQMETTMKNRHLVSWSPFREMRSLSEEMEKFFEEGLPALDRVVSLPAMPAVNIRQDEKNLYIEMPTPGYLEEDLDIDVAEEYITVAGQISKEDEEKKRGYFRQEYARQSFSRTVPLPVPVDADKADAVIEKGILVISLPKLEPEAPKTRKVTIKKK